MTPTLSPTAHLYDVAEPRPLRSREAHVRPVRIASRRLADENPRFSGDAEPHARGLLCVGWDKVGEKSYEVAWSGIKALRYGVS